MNTALNQTIQLTQEGYDEIVAELDELKAKEQTAIDRVATARSYGDLSENAEYHAAKEDLTFLTSRIEELQEVITKATVLSQGKTSSSVKVGSKVTVKHGRKTTTYHIVTAWESDPAENKISNESPLGKALMGKKQGDKIEIEVPAGLQTYEILKIE